MSLKDLLPDRTQFHTDPETGRTWELLQRVVGKEFDTQHHHIGKNCAHTVEQLQAGVERGGAEFKDLGVDEHGIKGYLAKAPVES